MAAPMWKFAGFGKLNISPKLRDKPWMSFISIAFKREMGVHVFDKWFQKCDKLYSTCVLRGNKLTMFSATCLRQRNLWLWSKTFHKHRCQVSSFCPIKGDTYWSESRFCQGAGNVLFRLQSSRTILQYHCGVSDTGTVFKALSHCRHCGQGHCLSRNCHGSAFDFQRNCIVYNKKYQDRTVSFCNPVTRQLHSSCNVNTKSRDHDGSDKIFEAHENKSRKKHTTEERKEQIKLAKDKVKEQLGELKEGMFTVPNVLTLSRMIAAPIIGYLVLNHSYTMACGVFVYAGITDLLDGWVARNFANQTSAMGSFLDPLADKLLVSILFVSLSIVHLLPVPLTALVIARDVGLIVAAFYVRYISLPPPVTLVRFFDITHVSAQLKPLYFSKVNTAVQLGLVAATLAAPVFGYVDHVALQALWYITATTTVASGVGYMFAKDTFKILRKRSRHKEIK